MGSIADSDVAQIANYVSNGDIDIKNVSVYDVLTDEGRTLGNQMSFHTIRKGRNNQELSELLEKDMRLELSEYGISVD